MAPAVHSHNTTYRIGNLMTPLANGTYQNIDAMTSKDPDRILAAVNNLEADNKNYARNTSVANFVKSSAVFVEKYEDMVGLLSSGELSAEQAAKVAGAIVAVKALLGE